MNNIIFSYGLRFVLLVLVQISLLNHINFLGFISPYLYVIFICLFPINNNRMVFLLLSFFLGLAIDIFSDSGGVHAAASVTIAFARPVILKFSFGSIYEHQNIKFKNVDFGAKMIYFFIMVIIHHIILFALEIFNISKILLVLQKSLFSGIFTIILCIVVSTIFSKKT